MKKKMIIKFCCREPELVKADGVTYCEECELYKKTIALLNTLDCDYSIGCECYGDEENAG